MGSAPDPSWLDRGVARPWSHLVLVVLLVGLIARLPGLNSDLWIDEIFTFLNMAQPFGRIDTPTGSAENHILYTILASFSSAILGPSPFALRVPAVIFGLLMIWATMELARLIGSRREALVVGLLAAVSYHAVWFSQNARGYIGIMFFFTAASALFYRGWHGRQWVWPWYVVTVALGMLMQPIMLVAPAAHATLLAGDLLLRNRFWGSPPPGTQLRAWLALTASGLLTMVLYAPGMSQVDRYTSTMGQGVPDYESALLVSLLEALTSNLTLVPVAAVLTGVALLGTIDLVRRDRLALAVLIVPLVWDELTTSDPRRIATRVNPPGVTLTSRPKSTNGRRSTCRPSKWSSTQHACRDSASVGWAMNPRGWARTFALKSSISALVACGPMSMP